MRRTKSRLAALLHRGLLSTALMGGLLSPLVCTVAAGSAQAYVRSRSSTCKPVYWAQTCLYIQADSGYVKDLPGTEVERILQQALDSWTTRTGASFMQLKRLPAAGPLEITYTDGLQAVKFRETTWCKPARDNLAQVCYDKSATAITTVSFVNKAGDPRDAQIIDADIELNAVNNHFFDADKGPAPTGARNPADLWNTLTHELGHLMGLEHTCRGPADTNETCNLDNTGKARPLCTDVARMRGTTPAYQSIYETAMYAVADPAETVKRIPKADDVLGITDSYPKSNDPKVCMLPNMPADPTGCSAGSSLGSSSGPAAGLGVSAAMLLLGLVLRRARRRPSSAAI